MKGREIINQIVRAKMPDRGKVLENCVRQAVPAKKNRKHPVYRRSITALATAGVLVCCFIFGNMLMNPRNSSNNFFTMLAYAMVQQEDGTIVLREVDLLNQTYGWSRFSDGKNYFVNISLKCEGENIRSVDFYADNGFFAKQYLKIENGQIILEEGVPASFRSGGEGMGYVLTMYGQEFDIIGNRFILNSDGMTDDFLLFLGTEVSDWWEHPSQMTVRAVATFNDGKTQEKIITLNLTDKEGIGVFALPSDKINRQAAREKYNELLHSIPLDKCEVVAGSVKILAYGDSFEYSMSESHSIVSTAANFQITEESINSAVEQGLFDENGIYIIGSNLPIDGSDGYITVIVKNGDGTFTGMVYKVPGQLILDNMK